MMQTYTKLSNNLVKMKKMDKFTEEQLQTQAQSVASARNMFLATIFNTTTQYIDPTTGITKYDFHYESKQFTENAGYFVNYPEANWQVILFWWSGIMHTLARRYPHVFKVQKVDNKKAANPDGNLHRHHRYDAEVCRPNGRSGQHPILFSSSRTPRKVVERE